MEVRTNCNPGLAAQKIEEGGVHYPEMAREIRKEEKKIENPYDQNQIKIPENLTTIAEKVCFFQERGLEIKRTKDKVCIIGCADSKNIAPLKDGGYELWGVNNLFISLPEVKFDRWFEIHSITFLGGHFLRREKREFRGLTADDYIEKIAELSCPIFMQKKWDSIKNSVVYPIQKVIGAFGRYFTNTISYEIALAILMGFKEIAIYGVDMAVSGEYHHQRPSCEYFIGIARGLGIEVVVPDEADLLKTRFIYAFEEQKEGAFKKKIKNSIASMQQRRSQSSVQRDNAVRQVEQYIGAELAMSEVLKIWESMDQ